MTTGFLALLTMMFLKKAKGGEASKTVNFLIFRGHIHKEKGGPTFFQTKDVEKSLKSKCLT